MTSQTIRPVTAAQLKSIIFSYDRAILDCSACVGAEELRHWIDCTESAIDRNVQLLDKGVSKQNQQLMTDVGGMYRRVRDKLDWAKTRISLFEEQQGLRPLS
jgi:hypothetical protein